MEKNVAEYQFGTIENILRRCEAEPTELHRQTGSLNRCIS